MKIDYSFLKEYLNKEADRLYGIVKRHNEVVEDYLAKIDKMQLAIEMGSERKWEYGNSIRSLKDKILESDIKIGHIAPKIKRLQEQVKAIDENFEML